MASNASIPLSANMPTVYMSSEKNTLKNPTLKTKTTRPNDAKRDQNANFISMVHASICTMNWTLIRKNPLL